MFELESFNVRFEQQNLAASKTAALEQQLWLLHGAGASSMARFSKLRENLFNQSIQTIGFDFIGHGKTGGDLSGSSLEHRVNQALAFTRMQKPPVQHILGSSMGAYVAVQLSQYYELETLILMVPGMYHKEAFNKQFGPEFSSIIRQDKSWIDSDAWEILSRFNGKLLLIYAEDDEVIPKDVIDKIMASASKASYVKKLCISRAKHGFLRHLEYDNPVLKEISNEIKNLIQLDPAAIQNLSL